MSEDYNKRNIRENKYQLDGFLSYLNSSLNYFKRSRGKIVGSLASLVLSMPLVSGCTTSEIKKNLKSVFTYESGITPYSISLDGPGGEGEGDGEGASVSGASVGGSSGAGASSGASVGGSSSGGSGGGSVGASGGGGGSGGTGAGPSGSGPGVSGPGGNAR